MTPGGVTLVAEEYDRAVRRRAKKAAERGPVYITDRGRPTHVLLTFEAYEKLVGNRRVLDLLAEPAGVEDVQLKIPVSDDRAEPATFD